MPAHETAPGLPPAGFWFSGVITGMAAFALGVKFKENNTNATLHNTIDKAKAIVKIRLVNKSMFFIYLYFYFLQRKEIVLTLFLFKEPMPSSRPIYVPLSAVAAASSFPIQSSGLPLLSGLGFDGRLP